MVEVEVPNTSLTRSNVYTNDATAAAVLTDIYARMSNGSYFFTTSTNSITVRTGLTGDELNLFGSSQNLGDYYLNNLSSSNSQTLWEIFYRTLYPVNAAVEGLSSSTSLTPAVKQQLTGEAKFLRAFIHFYLINIYGNAPLITSTDYRINSVMTRTAKEDVYKQIIADLKDAENLLSDNYVTANAMTTTTERVRPNKWTATALLSRVYLFTGDWVNAEAKATSLINNTGKYSLISDINNVFKKNSTESIWQLQPVNSNYNTEDARVFNLKISGLGNGSVYLSQTLLNSFEAGDQRKIKWIDSLIVSGQTYYFPYKYKANTGSVTEYLTIFRLAEQYLIRAEARAMQNNFSGSQSDLNALRTRSGLSNTTATTQPTLLTAILQERRVELFTELGHRWLDMKRTSTIDATMNIVAPAKGTIWRSTSSLYPIPLYDIQQNPNLSQNAGY
jgi:hypothetical protein